MLRIATQHKPSFARGGSARLALLLFLGGCAATAPTDGRKLLKLVPVKEFSLERSPEQSATLLGARRVRENGRDYILGWDKDFLTIYRYDASTGKRIDKLKFSEKEDFIELNARRKRGFSIDYFQYVNKDSVFVLFNPQYFSVRRNLADSTFMLVDWEGKIKQCYSMRGAPVRSLENEKAYASLAEKEMYEADWLKNMYYKPVRSLNNFHPWNQRFVVLFQPTTNSVPGDSLFESQNIGVGGSWNLKTDRYEAHNLCFPKVTRGGYYPLNSKVVGCAWFGNDLLYSFRYSDTIYVYDVDEHRVKAKHVLGSAFFNDVPTIHDPPEIDYRLKYPKVFPEYSWSHPQYYQIFTHPYEKQVIQINRPGLPTDASPKERQFPMYTMVVADSNFKVMGEGVMPPGLRVWGDFAPMFFPDGTVAFQNPEKSEAYENKYVFDVFKIEYENDPGGKKLKKAAADYRKSMASEAYTDLAKYLTQRHGAPAAGKRAFLLVPADNSCPSCLESVCRLYRDSISVFQSKNIGLVMTAASSATITKAATENGMPPGYLTDPKNVVLRYVPTWINPRWVVMENGKIVKDEFIHPAEIPNLRKKISEF